MKYLLSLFVVLFSLPACAATGDVVIDIIAPSGRRQAVNLTPSANMVIGFDGSGALVVKAGGGASTAWADITGKPSTFPPSAHNQAWSTITDTPTTLAGYGITNAQPLATVLTNTTASFTTALETKLNGIAAGAEVNVNADWLATSGDAQILNKPTLGTMASETATNYLTVAAAASTYVSLTGTYSNPTWITGLAWSKIIGAPSFITGASPTITTPTISGAVAFPDGVTQTFNPNGTASGLNVGAHTADPSSPANGDLFYNSTSNALRARINGAWVNLGAGSGSGATTFLDLTDTPSSYLGSHFLRVNDAGNAVEFFEPTITDVASYLSGNSGGLTLNGNYGSNIALVTGDESNAAQIVFTFLDSASDPWADYILEVPNNTGSFKFRLPPDNGASGETLKTDGAGNTYWDTSSGSGIDDGDTLTLGLTFPSETLKIVNDEATDYTVFFGVNGPEQNANRGLLFDVKNATRSVILAGNLETTGDALLSGTNTGDVTITDTDTIDHTLTGQALSSAARLQMSLTSDASGIRLVGDSASPGNNKVYGTNGSGARGWYDAGSGSGTVTSVGGTGSVNGLTLTGTVTSSGNLTLGGTLSGTASGLTAGEATAALGLKTATTTVSVSGATAPTSGQVLTATSSTTATFQTPSGGGGFPAPNAETVLTDTFSTTSRDGTWAAVTGFSASITPSTTSKKIRIEVYLTLGCSVNSGSVYYRVLRGGTPVGVGVATGSRTAITGGVNFGNAVANFTASTGAIVTDAPNTESPTTYSVEIMGAFGTTGTSWVNRPHVDDNAGYTARGISYIRLYQTD